MDKQEPNLKLSEAEKGWIAGIIDGEGCIGLYKGFKDRDRRRWQWMAVIQIGNTNKPLLLHTKQLCHAGALCSNGKSGYILRISSAKAVANILTEVSPYLVAKEDQGNLLLEGAKIIIKCGGVRTCHDLTPYDLRLKHIWSDLRKSKGANSAKMKNRIYQSKRLNLRPLQDLN